jgi:ribonuclease Z
MKIDLLVVAGRTYDTNPSIIILCENGSYLFNCPEGTQRLFFENKWKFSRVRQWFFTDLIDGSIGGALGTLLTMAGVVQTPFGVTCPPNIQELFTRSVTFSDTAEHLPPFSRDYADENIQIAAIPLTASTAYRVKLPDHPGRFRPDQAKALKVPPGPLFKKLANGESVTLADGSVVDPSQVVTPGTPNDVLLILNVKAAADFELISAVDLSEVDFFIHLTDPAILKTREYQALFPYDRKKHLCFEESGRVSYPTIFDLYGRLTGESLCVDADAPVPEHFMAGHSGLGYCFAPLAKQGFTHVQASVATPVVNSLPEFATFAVTFLGTGARMPSKTRNTTAILVHLHSGFVLLDCGEDTVGQLRRKYGPENTRRILIELQMLWVSHMHGDHYFGVQALLTERKKYTTKPLTVWADEPMLAELRLIEEFNGELHLNYVDRSTTVLAGETFELKGIPVLHIEGSHGCLLTIEGKWKLAFSGDHAVTDGFVEGVGECDLLIHEATFEDAMAEKAEEARHSTIGQAIGVGRAVSAKWVVLTHISPRYASVDLPEDVNNALFAFDYMSFAYEDIGPLCAATRQSIVALLETVED